MSSHPGIGVMIGYLSGNAETVDAHNKAMNKTVRGVDLNDDVLTIKFDDGELSIFDDGQSCCEHRYMRTDDDLASVVGAEFLGAELRDAAPEPDEYGDHEVQFLHLNTSVGTLVFSNHNEHNGYYGGFHVVLRWREAAQ